MAFVRRRICANRAIHSVVYVRVIGVVIVVHVVLFSGGERERFKGVIQNHNLVKDGTADYLRLPRIMVAGLPRLFRPA
jgi:hypothetical protein